MNPEHQAIYEAYLATDHFQCVRAYAVQQAGGRCQVCTSRDRLNAHHNSYENLMCEAPEDVIILCSECHRIFHENGRLRGLELSGIDWGRLARYVRWETPEYADDDSPGDTHVCIGCGRMIPVGLIYCSTACKSRIGRRNALGVPLAPGQRVVA